MRFEFEPETGTPSEAGYIEFKLDTGEVTQLVFLKVTDHNSANSSETNEELEEIWDGLIAVLREKVGG